MTRWSLACDGRPGERRGHRRGHDPRRLGRSSSSIAAANSRPMVLFRWGTVGFAVVRSPLGRPYRSVSRRIVAWVWPSASLPQTLKVIVPVVPVVFGVNEIR